MMARQYCGACLSAKKACQLFLWLCFVHDSTVAGDIDRRRLRWSDDNNIDVNSSVDLGIPKEELSSQDIESLPTVGQVAELYGPKPVILGLERCEEFRNHVPPEDRFMGIAGMYNSGTNVLHKTLARTCVLPNRKESFEKHGYLGSMRTGVLIGVPWGKHSPLHLRPTHLMPGLQAVDFARFTAMPLVIVKDPVFWMRSMCLHWYDAYSIQSDKNWFRRCPYLAADESGTAIPINGKLAPWQEEFQYESLIDMWNSFYKAYDDFQSPRLMLRYEDLIYHGEEVATTICDCAGGQIRKFKPYQESTKENDRDENGNANGMVKSAILYGSKEARDSILQTGRDLRFAQERLDPDLMEKFQYQMPSAAQGTDWTPHIPQKIWFVGPHENQKYIENVASTVAAYKTAWDQPEAQVVLLNDDDCQKIIEEIRPDLLASFSADMDTLRKRGACRVAALYKHGGYGMTTAAQAVVPVRPRDDISFVGPSISDASGCILSASLVASAPEHQILKAALDAVAESYDLSDVFSPPVLLKEKMMEAYHTLPEETKARGLLQLQEAKIDSISYSENDANIQRQFGRGDCDSVVRDSEKPDVALFFSYFLGSDQCKPGRIPRKLWFSREDGKALSNMIPQEENDFLLRVVEEYQMVWDEPDAFVGTLSDNFCSEVVNEASQSLMEHFLNIHDVNLKDDICRVATMYVHGGFYFGENLRIANKIYNPMDNAEFVATSLAHGVSLSTTGFAAVIPEHPIVKRAINLVLLELDSAGSHSDISLSRILAQSFHSLTPRYRGEVVLLDKNLKVVLTSEPTLKPLGAWDH